MFPPSSISPTDLRLSTICASTKHPKLTVLLFGLLVYFFSLVCFQSWLLLHLILN